MPGWTQTGPSAKEGAGPLRELTGLGPGHQHVLSPSGISGLITLGLVLEGDLCDPSLQLLTQG